MAATDVLKPDHAAPRRHFIFTDEHEALRESIHAFVMRELAPHAEEWEETTFPDWVFHRMGELGFLGLSMPEEYGGQGGDYFCNLVLAEELVVRRLGRAWRWASRSTPTWRRRRSCSSAPRSRSSATWCRRSAARRSPASGSPSRMRAVDVRGIRTRAVRDGDEWVINGAKTYITNGHRADFIVLVTKTDPDAGYDGFTLFIVDMDLPGVIREKKLEKLGMHASDTALLAFDDVRVPADAVLGQIGKGFYHIMWELQGERLIGAAGCVAGAQRAFDRTLAYALERKAFGREIGHFQVIRHKFAAMATKIEAGAAARVQHRLALRERRVPGARDLDGEALRLADVLRGRRRVPADPRRRRLHARVQDRAGLARPAPEPDRRGHRRDHARRDWTFVQLVVDRAGRRRVARETRL